MESTIARQNLEKSSNDNTLSKEKGWMEEVLATQGLKHPNPRKKFARE
jgi:hypothetical protein